MKWTLLLAFLMPLQAAATIIDYRFTGSATDLADYAPERDILIDFSIDTETTLLMSFEMTFQGDLWLPNESNLYQLSVFSTEPEGAGTIPTFWLTWNPTLTNGQNTLVFYPYPEWKLYHNGSITNPLLYLEESFIGAAYAETDDGRAFGIGGTFVKVPEPATWTILLAGTLICFNRRRQRSLLFQLA